MENKTYTYGISYEYVTMTNSKIIKFALIDARTAYEARDNFRDNYHNRAGVIRGITRIEPLAEETEDLGTATPMP